MLNSNSSKISVFTNGVANIQNGRSFFHGAAKAATIGIISGGISFGIGTAAQSLFSGSKIAQAGFQALAHGISGGAMAELQGGQFKHGFVSGAISSVVSSGAGALGTGPEIMIAAGGLSGGLGSWATGGSFWSGLRQGLITSGLNHAMHELVQGNYARNELSLEQYNKLSEKEKSKYIEKPKQTLEYHFEQTTANNSAGPSGVSIVVKNTNIDQVWGTTVYVKSKFLITRTTSSVTLHQKYGLIFTGVYLKTYSYSNNRFHYYMGNIGSFLYPGGSSETKIYKNKILYEKGPLLKYLKYLK